MSFVQERLNNLPDSDRFHPDEPTDFAGECIANREFLEFPMNSLLIFKVFAADLVLRDRANSGDFRHYGPDPEITYRMHNQMLDKILEEYPELNRAELERIIEDAAQYNDGAICRFTDAYEKPCIRTDSDTGEITFVPVYTNLERKLRELDRTQRKTYLSFYAEPGKLDKEGSRIMEKIKEAHPGESADERLKAVQQEQDKACERWNNGQGKGEES